MVLPAWPVSGGTTVRRYKLGKVPMFRKLFLLSKIYFRILKLFRLKELELKGSKMARGSTFNVYYWVGVNF